MGVSIGWVHVSVSVGEVVYMHCIAIEFCTSIPRVLLVMPLYPFALLCALSLGCHCNSVIVFVTVTVIIAVTAQISLLH